MAVSKEILVEVVIDNKPFVRDPEGETILKDLLVKNGFTDVKSVRTAKLLRLRIDASSEDEALRLSRRMCEELRLYNPVVSRCDILVKRGTG